MGASSGGLPAPNASKEDSANIRSVVGADVRSHPTPGLREVQAGVTQPLELEPVHECEDLPREGLGAFPGPREVPEERQRHVPGAP